MYSHAAIIFGAVASALFGLYVFVPNGGLRTSDYWLGVWQPMVWNASAVTHSTSSEQKEESQFPLHPSYEEEVMDENQFQFISHEDITKRLQALSDLHGPEFEPGIPSRVPLSRMRRLHQAVVEILSILWPHFIIYLLPYLVDIVLAQKTCALRKLQKLYQAEKPKNVELLAGQKSKKSLDKAKNRDEDEEEKPTTPDQSEQERTETLDDTKSNGDRVRDIMVEGPGELPESKGMPAKRRRPGKRNSKRDHKFEAEKRKRKQAEKKAAMAGITEESREETHEKERGKTRKDVMGGREGN